MAAPKYIKAKAEALSRALEQVAKLSSELADWYESKTDAYAAQDFYYYDHLDSPWDFNYRALIEDLDKAADGKKQHRGCY